MKYAILVLAVLAVASVSYGAMTVWSWENTTNGWTVPTGDTASVGTVGVTDGSYSWAVVCKSGATFDNQLKHTSGMPGKGYPDTTANGDFGFNGDTAIACDITTAGTNVVVGFTLDTFGAGPLFPTTPYNVGGGEWNPSNFAPVNCSSDGVTLKTTHVVWDFSSVWPGWMDTWGWSECRMIVDTTGSTGPQTVYFDKLQTVPEPATMSLLVVGAGMLLKRRRA